MADSEYVIVFIYNTHTYFWVERTNTRIPNKDQRTHTRAHCQHKDLATIANEHTNTERVVETQISCFL